MALSVEEKRCNGCGVTMPITNFHARTNRKCGVASKCKSCIKIYSAEYNRINSKERYDKYKIYLQQSEERKQAALEREKKWKRENREKVGHYERQKRREDPFFRLKKTLRERVRDYLKTRGFRKSCSTLDMIGADPAVVKQHIEKQFTDGMRWDNHGEWHIDHKIPLSSAKTEEQLKALFHYTNMQPLWAKDNLTKSDKILHYAT